MNRVSHWQDPWFSTSQPPRMISNRDLLFVDPHPMVFCDSRPGRSASSWTMTSVPTLQWDLGIFYWTIPCPSYCLVPWFSQHYSNILAGCFSLSSLNRTEYLRFNELLKKEVWSHGSSFQHGIAWHSMAGTRKDNRNMWKTENMSGSPPLPPTLMATSLLSKEWDPGPLRKALSFMTVVLHDVITF